MLGVLPVLLADTSNHRMQRVNAGSGTVLYGFMMTNRSGFQPDCDGSAITANGRRFAGDFDAYGYTLKPWAGATLLSS